MKYTVTINDKAYEVEVEKGVANVVKTTSVVTAAPVVATPVAAPVAPAAVAVAPTAVAGGTPIAAPMPGTILGVKVAPGETVKEGQLVFVLEAMKMENEIFAPKDGVIAQVLVAKGAAVNTGDALAVIQ